MSTTRPFTAGVHEVVRAEADAVLEGFPEPPETFRLAALPEWARRTFRRLDARDLTVAVATEYDADSHAEYTCWRLDERVWEFAADVRAQREPLCPCGHAGVTNMGDHYVCGFVGCRATFEPSDLVEGDE